MNINEFFTRPEDGSLLAPERRIVLAALDSIAEFGLEGTTVRVIAARAGLNPAAVNYYFRSKDRLVEEALRGAWVHVSEDIDRIIAARVGGRETMRTATAFLIEGAWRYPKLIRAIVVEHPVLRLEAATYLKDIFKRVADQSGSSRDSELGSVLLIAFAVLLGFATDAVSLVTGFDLNESEDRGRLSESLAELLFGPVDDHAEEAD
jgi:AcrR family transcriptional regulator